MSKTDVALIEQRIYTIRGVRVILDSDLAALYGRNRKRFPEDFAFQLTAEEADSLRSQIATSRSHGGRRYRPYAFTEHGALQAANILNSANAVRMSVFVIRAFVKIREQLVTNAAILKRLAEIDKTLLVHDSALRDLYQKLLPLLSPPPEPPRRRIGFHPS
jgi:hypothetical protein